MLLQEVEIRAEFVVACGSGWRLAQAARMMSDQVTSSINASDSIEASIVQAFCKSREAGVEGMLRWSRSAYEATSSEHF